MYKYNSNLYTYRIFVQSWHILRRTSILFLQVLTNMESVMTVEDIPLGCNHILFNVYILR